MKNKKISTLNLILAYFLLLTSQLGLKPTKVERSAKLKLLTNGPTSMKKEKH